MFHQQIGCGTWFAYDSFVKGALKLFSRRKRLPTPLTNRYYTGSTYKLTNHVLHPWGGLVNYPRFFARWGGFFEDHCCATFYS